MLLFLYLELDVLIFVLKSADCLRDVSMCVVFFHTFLSKDGKSGFTLLKALVWDESCIL